MSGTTAENLVRLVINGAEYGGWKKVRISGGIERQARDFELEVTDRWPGQPDIPRRVRPFDACQLFIGQDLVLTGYIDATPIHYDGATFSVGVKGRSKTEDLVDCCPIDAGATVKKAASKKGKSGSGWSDVVGADGKTGSPARVVPATTAVAAQWHGQKIEAIAAALAAPYGIRVLAEVDTGDAIPAHSVQVGETVFESIDRMMRLRHVLSTDNEKGDLVLIDVGSSGRATTAIELGKNVMECDAPLDYKEVYSRYVCKGQRAGNDDQYGADVAEGEGISDEEDDSGASGDSAEVTDSRAKRLRVLVIKQEGQSDDGTCQDRAAYERAHRAAKALQTTYTVAGWRQDDGSLWRPNLLARVRDAVVGFDVDMVIAEVSLIMDDKGLRAELTVGPPDGYRTKAAKVKKTKKGKHRKGGHGWGDVQ